MIPVALTIAGSDSGGGAGIQADLKTFSALGVYGCSVITALTTQTTRDVRAVSEVQPAFVSAQLDAVFEDIRVDAVKIGMLANAAIIEAVAEALARHRPRWVVLGPVMVAKSGDRLLAQDAVAALVERLLPLADLITPNLAEAAALVGEDVVRERRQMPQLAARLQGLGARNVLVKGGHLDGPASPDFLLYGGEHHWFEAPRVPTRHSHGTGCTLSSAIAALLARGRPLPEAVARAKDYLQEALRRADELEVGGGRGPVHHFHALWRGEER